ncbi:hypothetical protein F511_14395 [Dorcoceras hygrometricum]|uniref:Uncharacterized protein n=1 Tax=Dorcoceras hygrometricum TaxID=472368 RepID=A0A2Z7BX23_9LAMI|nr:hypothetical protein F511_14395 [Dorcoceras hygrometricum]
MRTGGRPPAHSSCRWGGTCATRAHGYRPACATCAHHRAQHVRTITDKRAQRVRTIIGQRAQRVHTTLRNMCARLPAIVRDRRATAAEMCARDALTIPRFLRRFARDGCARHISRHDKFPTSANQLSPGSLNHAENSNPVPPLNEVLTANTKLRTVGNAYPKAETSGRTIGFHCAKETATLRSSSRSLHSLKWVTIEREIHKNFSATEIAQNNYGERKQLSEKNHGEQ